MHVARVGGVHVVAAGDPEERSISARSRGNHHLAPVS